MVEPLASFDEDVWELYDTTTDWSQSRDLAAELPEKLAELKDLWLAEARRYGDRGACVRRRRSDHRPGGAVAGWSLYVREGKARYRYNLLGLQHFVVEGESAVPPGTHQVRMEFSYGGGGLAKGGTVSLYLDGTKDGEGRVDATVPLVFSADETQTSGATRPRPSATSTRAKPVASPAG